MSDYLDYESHLEECKRRCGANEEGQDEGVLERSLENAYHSHGLVVLNSLRDLFLRTTSLSESLKNDHAKSYMLHGAGRRLRVIYNTYKKINAITYEGRTEILGNDTEHELNGAINSIYMDLHALLNIYAWCVLYEKDYGVIKLLTVNEVTLFSKAEHNKSAVFTALKKELKGFYKWHDDISERRNPVTHKIPLYVPSPVITEDESKEYEQHLKKYNECVKDLNLEEAKRSLENVEMFGKFWPHFVEHPNQPHMPIYPTIPMDIANLIKISKIVENTLLGIGKVAPQEQEPVSS